MYKVIVYYFFLNLKIYLKTINLNIIIWINKMKQKLDQKIFWDIV